MKIYINGRGSISAAGANPAAAFRAFKADKPTWVADEKSGLPVYRVGSLPEDSKIEEFTNRRGADRSTVLALHAATQAVTSAGWQGKEFAVLVGCSRGPTVSWEEHYDHFKATDVARTKASPQTTLGGVAFALADYFGTRSLTTGMSVTCSSGFHALLHGVALLRSGMAERVLVGGAEAALTPFTLKQMQALRIYAEAPPAGVHACRPMSTPKSGMAIGEGAAFVALSRERSDHEIGGVGFAREQVQSTTGISKAGEGLQASMKMARAEAAVTPDAVVPHAPGTKGGDEAERAALLMEFGAPVAVHSAKQLTGHTFGASGPLGLDFACSLLEDGYERLMVNATGFGGNAVSVIVKK